MVAPRVLFVKLSSLGDVIHHLPAVSDLRAHRPEVRIDWAVEEAYADLVRLHPAVERAIPVGLRRAKRSLWAGSTWRALFAVRRTLSVENYDFIVDTQGLAKSAIVASQARGARFGFDRASARERLAARFYDQSFRVARNLHAVARNRQLVGDVFGYRPEGFADYGLAAPDEVPAWMPTQPFYVALHAASRAAKRWDDANWIALAGRMAERGIVAVYPGGNEEERAAAAKLAAASPGGVAAPAMSLVEAAAILSRAQCVAGVDTGLTHLAVALGRTTAGIYVATDPSLTGLHGGPHATSLGGRAQKPSVDAVEAALGFAPEPAPAFSPGAA